MFTKVQYDLLSRNLNFCPTHGHYNENILRKVLDSFNRKIKLKVFFQNKDEQKQQMELANEESGMKRKTISEPKKNHHITKLKRLSKQSKKLLWKGFQIKINYLKMI